MLLEAIVARGERLGFKVVCRVCFRDEVRRTENRAFKERESSQNLLKISTGESIKGVCLGKERG